MPAYVWKGKNSYGEKRKGEVEAVDLAAALAQIKRLRISEPGCERKAQGPLGKYLVFSTQGNG